MLTRKAKSDAVREDADKAEKSGVWEILSTIAWAIGIALVLRTFVFQPFTIPSGSMYPGLMEGDYVITSKYSVGYGRYAAMPLPFPDVDGRLFARGPDRGDVIVFRPDGIDQNYIKRVVGLPGERLQMINGVLHINGEAAGMELLGTENYTHRRAGRVLGSYEAALYAETLPGMSESHLIYDGIENNGADNTTVFTVPAGHYFMMGDNRDFSGDSRVPVVRQGAGYVPAENIIGRAEFVLASVDEDFVLYKPWTWGNFRGGRFFMGVG
ncbi:signal peptidase I [uncultured Algimonas sp.]|uniref:signal peptidase I n=1 Tax=uncultured Algimonas sp. TaxID=1547920 RepID=UPI00262E8F21|nr:signal peptidase I [uncultured Algimonas sp.]